MQKFAFLIFLCYYTHYLKGGLIMKTKLSQGEIREKLQNYIDKRFTKDLTSSDIAKF